MKTCLVLLLMLGASGYAQSAGTFTATGNMTTVRWLATATLLPNGKVLFAGGFKSLPMPPGILSSLATAELYDPATATFSRTGDMIAARAEYSATLLPDGKVLMAGGRRSDNIGDYSATAELYDPATATFSRTGDMIAALPATATLLPDGKVLIAHYVQTPATKPVPAELYDPATGTFSATGDQQISPVDANLLPDGRVLLFTCCGQVRVQLYDPASGAFSLTSTMTFVNPYSRVTLLTNGKVLLSGGLGNDESTHDGADLYDPSTGTSAATANMTTGRGAHSATLLPDRTVLMAGGLRSDNSTDFGATAELYDPATATFSRTGDMIAGRWLQTTTLLLDGTVLIAGGLGGGGRDLEYLASAELYTPAVLVPAPVLFSLSGDGRGQGAIWHAQTGQIASADNPAVAGEALSMYTTSLVDGGVVPPQVAIGGRLAEVLYFGASGYPGYNQVNYRVPSGVAPGPAVPARLTYLGRPSNAITIGVQ